MDSIKIGFIRNNSIPHTRLREVIKIMCEKLGWEFIVDVYFKDCGTKRAELAQCDYIIDEHRQIRRDGEQKIIYWVTGAGDLSSLALMDRQKCPNLDIVVTPRIRRSMHFFNKYVAIGDPISLYFEKYKSYVQDFQPKNTIFIPEENCFTPNEIVDIVKPIAEKEGLEIVWKKRDNNEAPEVIFEYLKCAKYVIAGFSTLIWEGMYFGIPGFMVGGLDPMNATNENKLFYNELCMYYPELIIRSYNSFKHKRDTTDFNKIRDEWFNDNFLKDFVAVLEGN